ncbi:hypothetical protein LY13_001216 [Prauserella aidingensis]|nr:hypothetical protein [Prauserella aidingensis]
MMVLLTPVHGFGLVLALLSAGSSDASGQGGPFRACTADSVSCTGPNVPLIVAVALAMLACLGIAVRAGMRTGRLPPRWRHRGMLSCAGVAAAVVVDTVAVLVR